MEYSQVLAKCADGSVWLCRNEIFAGPRSFEVEAVVVAAGGRGDFTSRHVVVDGRRYPVMMKYDAELRRFN